MEQENIARQIKKIRCDKNLTQNQLAEILGVTFQSVSKWENGKNIPDVTLLNKISSEFNVDINVLLNGESSVCSFKNKKIIFVGFSLFFLIIFIFLFFYFNKTTEVVSNMKLTEITTMASDFSVSGSLVVDGSSAVIYVSDIEYVGEKKDFVFKDITFSLIEDDENLLIKIDEHIILDNSKSFEEVVSDISFIVENYSSSCNTFSCNSLFIKVYALDYDDKIMSFEIPLTSIENCSCEN